MNRSKIKEYGFDKNDWNHFHDVILDATWNTGKVSLNQEQMEDLFCELPDDMREEARMYGMNDTLWRDSLYIWYKNNKNEGSKR